jgi:hypothetical protein
VEQVWIVQEFASKGSLLDALEKGMLQLPNGKPNMSAILMAAQEIAGEQPAFQLWLPIGSHGISLPSQHPASFSKQPIA